MASFDVVNYSLRPSKSIQRQIVFEGVRILQQHLDLERLVYVGFGSVWFTDFVMAHKLLGIDDMISIEGDDVGFRRAEFNRPFATVKVLHGRSSEVLPPLFGDIKVSNRPWMIWLDCDYELNESLRDDIRSVVEKAPVNSIFLVTYDGSEKKYGSAPIERPEWLRGLLGSVVPDDLSKESCKDQQLHVTLADLSLDFMKATVAELARPGGFVPAFRIIYQDKAKMITVGGILPAKGAARTAAETVAQKSWPCRPEKPIVVPLLTIREAAVLQAQLPCLGRLSRDSVRQLGFDLEEEQIEAFESYYRHYPAYAQIVV